MTEANDMKGDFNDGEQHRLSRPMAMGRAAFVVSIDTEMAWGTVHRGAGRRVRATPERERTYIRKLLDLMDRFRIPGTFAVVGHLFLKSCRANAEGKHPEIVRPNYHWFEGDWFDSDPCSNAELAPEWYAPDVIVEIQRRSTGHEIASHSFCHIIVGDPDCSAEAFESDLRACQAAARPYGLDLLSFVYPRNSIGHRDVLRREGFVAYRGRQPQADSRAPRAWQSALRLADSIVLNETSVVRPRLESNGLLSLPGSYLYDVSGSRWRDWLRIKQMTRRLRQACRHRGLFHLWFHPHNLDLDPARAFAGLESVFRLAARLRDRGSLETLTMVQLAERLLAERLLPDATDTWRRAAEQADDRCHGRASVG